MEQRVKTISLVKYNDFSLIKFENGKSVGEIPVIPCNIHFEYIDSEISPKDFIAQYGKKMKSNCIADIVLFEIFQLQVNEDAYNLTLKMVNNQKEIVIREFFKGNMFNENSKVLQVGTFNYLQRDIRQDSGLVC